MFLLKIVYSIDIYIVDQTEIKSSQIQSDQIVTTYIVSYIYLKLCNTFFEGLISLTKEVSNLSNPRHKSE